MDILDTWFTRENMELYNYLIINLLFFCFHNLYSKEAIKERKCVY